MDAVIVPDPSEPERRVLLAALAAEAEEKGKGRPPADAWREAALREPTGAEER